jgi:hypothetical protein
MMIMLAQANEAEPAGQGMLTLLERLTSLELPSRGEFVSALESLSALQAVALAAVGLVYLFCGYKVFKALVIINAAALGGLVGAFLGSRSGSANMPILMALAGAVLLGALAWPMLHYAVGLLGALAGGLLGYSVWTVIALTLNNESLLHHAWAGGLIGMVAVGMLAFVAFPATVMIFTALQGALMTIAGVCSLLLVHSGMGGSLRAEMIENDYLLKMLIGVPAIVGFALQHSTGGKGKPKPKPAGKPA